MRWRDDITVDLLELSSAQGAGGRTKSLAGGAERAEFARMTDL